MSETEVFQYLCSRDKRNPLWLFVWGDDSVAPEPRVSCSCDNCFYGRDKLAMEIIRLLNSEGGKT